MGVFTSKKTGKVFATKEGLEVWICTNCHVAFLSSTDFFYHNHGPDIVTDRDEVKEKVEVA